MLGIDFKIFKANPRHLIKLTIPRQHWWRHVDAYSGENWVECIRDGKLAKEIETPGASARIIGWHIDSNKGELI